MESLPRLVIYTSLVGGADVLKNPQYVLENCDYICFSNDTKPDKSNDLWTIKPIPYVQKNSRRLSRYVKIKPHQVLHEYDYSVWIDSNMEIIGKEVEDRIKALIADGVDLALIPHPVRDCIYMEAEICIRGGKDKLEPVKKLCEIFRKEGYPSNNGLFENGLIFRKHNAAKIVNLNNEWWDMYINYSQRDQLSLGFLMWKNKISCKNFFPIGFSVRNVSSIHFSEHKPSIVKKLKRRCYIVYYQLFLKSGKLF